MEERRILNHTEIESLIETASKSIYKDIKDINKFAIVGLQTRGVELASRMKRKIEALSGVQIKSGVLDITFHRDDLATRGILPVIKETRIEFDITDMIILLVDDVIFTGRTSKAALESIMAYGRPRAVRYFVLVDRGNRELPIQPDYCGYRIKTDIDDKVRVKLAEVDAGSDEVLIYR
jgi:pyrimidine operon attenuation protein/uracil phosphoribosyltransferase